ncbi:hypothetical protein NLG97_g8211 [Lecanicillium saksenae]|uniref:Uncharacterized protein n=1 Tax=Lecanicillium saksenae TaxID=468837 RepID=A0ACC1QLZ1_9HYPO|nr:hypothetical protein NLG97_g8211 [Lecanicillium saksenae]
MFDNIALNLKPGGFFVGVVPYPTEDVAERGRRCKSPEMKGIYPFLDFTRELEDGSGWYNTIHIDETLNFEAAHHKKANLPREEFLPPGVVPVNDLTPEQYAAFADIGILAVIKIYKK